MGFFEALIIYLAIGTPFGVYAIVRAKGSLKQNAIALLTANILLWPVFASLELVPKSNSFGDPKYFIDDRPHSASSLEKTRSSFKESLTGIGDRDLRRSAMEGFERYAALTRACSSAEREVSIAEIFKISGHLKAQTASNCLARRNGKMLASHRDQAAADLNALADSLTMSDRSVFESAIQTARKELEFSIS